MDKQFSVPIGEELSDSTVGYVLRNNLQLSGTQIKRAKRFDDGIVLNGRRVTVREMVHPGDILLVTLHEHIVPQPLEARPGSLDVIYEDEDILIINKASGVVMHPTRDHRRDSLANDLCWRYGQDFIFRPINRLDKDTSGLMMAAKNGYAHELFRRQLHTGDFQREYRALVHGRLAQYEGSLTFPIRRKPENRDIRREVHADGQSACTHYKLLESCDSYSLLSLILDTGRTHQIRVHVSHLGHPIIGDRLYGDSSKDWMERTALHCYRIGFYHPNRKEMMEFKIDMPTDMIDFIMSVKKNEVIASNYGEL